MSNLPLACRDRIDRRSPEPCAIYKLYVAGLSAEENPINYYT